MSKMNADVLDEDETLAVGLIMARRQQRQRRARRRKGTGRSHGRPGGQAYHTLVEELRLQCPEDFVGVLRMEPAMFQDGLLRVCSRINKTDFRCSLFAVQMHTDLNDRQADLYRAQRSCELSGFLICNVSQRGVHRSANSLCCC